MRSIFQVGTAEQIKNGREFIKIYCVAKKPIVQESLGEEKQYGRRQKIDDDTSTNCLCKAIITRYRRGFYFNFEYI